MTPAMISLEPASNGEPFLGVRDLRTYFSVRGDAWSSRAAQVRAVDGISFDIPRGTTLGLVGESGCGKTTVGRTILRLIEATGGEVVFDGVDVLRASARTLQGLRRQMQIVFQDAAGSLNPRMRVGAIVSEPLEIHLLGDRSTRRRRVAEVLERVGLRASDADKYPHEFSGGQRQRIGIARALAASPKFIVLDEPVSALDVSVQAQVLNLLADLKGELGLTYLFIAHNLAVVAQFSDRVAVMYLGKIVEIADTAELYSRPQHPYTQALLAAVPRAQIGGRRPPVSLAGEPPSPTSPPAGCSFHPRCPYQTDECRARTPVLSPVEGFPPSHRVACHHAGSLTAGAAEKKAEIGEEKTLATVGAQL